MADVGKLESFANILLLDFFPVVFSWYHIHWGLIHFQAPYSSSYSKDTALSLVTTVDSYKSDMCLFKCEYSKDINNPGKEDICF